MITEYVDGFRIGDVVVKISKKPFKSMLRVATIRAFGDHPITGKKTAYFNEDESYVEVRKLKQIGVEL